MRILIVDDMEVMRKVIGKCVGREDDIIMECEDGESAVDICQRYHPDWILMDIRMKKMNGIMAAEKIRQIMPQVKIAFVTGYDDYSYRQAAARLGIRHYFLKNNLLEIRKVLDNELTC